MWCEPGCQHSKNSKLLTCTIRCIIYSPNFFVEARECKCSMVANQMQGRRKWGVGGRGAVVPSDFGRPASPLPTRGRLCPPHYYSSLQIFKHSYDPVAQRRKLALFGLSSRIYEDILRTKNTQKNASFCYGCSCYCLFLLWLNSPKTPFLCSKVPKKES